MLLIFVGTASGLLPAPQSRVWWAWSFQQPAQVYNMSFATLQQDCAGTCLPVGTLTPLYLQKTFSGSHLECNSSSQPWPWQFIWISVCCRRVSQSC